VAVRLLVRDAGTGAPLPISTATLVHSQLPAECASEKDDIRCGRRARKDATKPDAADAKPDAVDTKSNNPAGGR
jgi:hypothetical protein